EEQARKARELQEESSLAYKQASAIRSEAQSESSKGAKLGGMANAEEKEAEALLKQQEAVDILMKYNAGFALKKPETGLPSPGSDDRSEKIARVNKTVAELDAAQESAWTDLYTSNDQDAANRITTLENKEQKTPRQKSELIAARG